MSFSWMTIAIIGLFLILSISIYINVKLGLTILKVEDEVTKCLDIIDERYESISKILEIPIFFDSLEVRQVVDDIRITRFSLLEIANSLTSIQKEEKVEK
tara:strand:+ start:2725 stop:3024 length:300 start_codon:yes stop_codon:yes gene_type:complete